jgi:hypothetical protein
MDQSALHRNTTSSSTSSAHVGGSGGSSSSIGAAGTTCAARQGSDDLDITDKKRNNYSLSAWTETFKHIFAAYVLPIGFVALLLAIIIWDMSKMHEMSEIIHDDHTDLWEQMNSTAVSQWFTPLDQCMLGIKDSSVDIRQYRAENCSQFQGGRGVQHNRLFCGIGSSLGRACPAPLTKRNFFTARLIGDGLGDPDAGHLSRTLRRLAGLQIPVIFLGDAISKQNHEALMCEMLRTDKVWATGSIYGMFNSSISNYTIHWKDSPSVKLDVYFIHMSRIAKSSSNGMDKHAHRSNRTSGNSLTTKTLLSLSMSFPEVKERIKDILDDYQKVVLIANVGIWYNSRERFRQEAPDLIKWLSKMAENNIVLFRETSAQHWNHTDTGYFALDGDSTLSSCTPVADSSPEYDWRNRDVRQIIENEELKGIHIIPFHDITAPLHDMHPDSEVWEDCTHFCYFPQMWQPVWFYLFRLTNEILNRAEAASNVNSSTGASAIRHMHGRRRLRLKHA